MIVADEQATRHDDASTPEAGALWQEDFVVNLGKTARNPNAGLRFTI